VLCRAMKLYAKKCSATECSRCSIPLLNAFVSRVNRRVRIRIVRFCRSTDSGDCFH
jgi:hypothetical protein